MSEEVEELREKIEDLELESVLVGFRDEIVSRLGERFKDALSEFKKENSAEHERIKKEVEKQKRRSKKQKRRVEKLELWRAYVVGGITFLLSVAAIIFGAIEWMALR